MGQRQDGPALSLNGQDDRVIIPDSDSMYLEKAWSITSWVHVTNPRTVMDTFSAKDPPGVWWQIMPSEQAPAAPVGKLTLRTALERCLESESSEER